MFNDNLDFSIGFRIVGGNARSQAAVMVIEPGEQEGGPDNRHRGSDQWLLVTEGTGIATINGREMPIATGTLILVEAGETHAFRNTGLGLLKTVNIYVPPAYDKAGDELPAGEG